MARFEVLNSCYLHRNMGAARQLSNSVSRGSSDGSTHHQRAHKNEIVQSLGSHHWGPQIWNTTPLLKEGAGTLNEEGGPLDRRYSMTSFSEL